MALISVAEARQRLLRLVAPLEPEEIALAEAGGRVLARDVVAARAQPPFPAASMDGYALRAADAVPGARLRLVGLSSAGAGSAASVGPGEAVRIFTGAPVPDGADRVVMQEDTTREGDALVLGPALDASPHIRPAGVDFAPGDRLAAPRRMRPADVALAAAMNAGIVWVTRRPAVALIPTGDELVMPGEEPGPDQIVASNNFGLKALFERAGAEVRLLPIARDSTESLTAVLALAADADLIVTLGGASVGDFDLVRETALAQGLTMEFHKVAMRPGKPLMAGRLGTVPLIGLPGNPVSAMVCGQIFVRPVIEVMLGLPADVTPPIRARLACDIGPNGPRAHYLRAEVTAAAAGWTCRPFERQDSALLSVLAAANALMVRPPGDPARRAGDTVEFLWTD